VVINQHLFFAGVPLPAFHAVIFDEAHNLEEVAAHFLGFSLTSLKIKRLLDDIFNPGSGRGLAKRLKSQPPLWLPRIQEAISDAHFATKMFFEDIRTKLNLPDAGKQPDARRVRQPHLVDDQFSRPLQKLAALLAEAVALSQSGEDEAEIKALRNRCLQTVEQLAAFLACASKEHAYWVEVHRSKGNPHTSLCMAPLDVSDSLRKGLFAKHRPVILTSATLAVDGSLDMLKSRLGLDDSLDVLLDSPFEYERQAVLLSAPDVPDPKESAAFEKAVLEHCPKIAESVTGGVFVLYTSWQLLEKSAQALTTDATNRPVFKQGSKPPQQLLSDFKRAGNGVLLATDTFWQGIDVPGPALSCVIITRLPFLAPDTPLEEARHEWMAAKGMNVFNEYTLPKAIIKFRQGFGRLIRSSTDFGAVVILDPRIRTRKYGGMFLRSIPKCRQASSLAELKDFFAARA
jgi:ATP-dependent DNA helicase DinG